MRWRKIKKKSEFRLSFNVSISWEMNFFDKNTCYGKGISEKNEFSTFNLSTKLLEIRPKSKN